MKKTAIIVAGGVGLRAGGSVPKQLQELHGIPVFAWSIYRFIEQCAATRIVLVINASFREDFERYIPDMQKTVSFDCKIVAGGATRAESVMNALAEIEPAGDMLIAVHDAARPLVSTELISRGWEAAAKCGAAVPVVPMTDSIRHIQPDGASISVPRSEYVAVQTPQVFKSEILCDAYKLLSSGKVSPKAVTDDASVVEIAGGTVSLYEGEHRNFKITGPQDLLIASTLI